MDLRCLNSTVLLLFTLSMSFSSLAQLDTTSSAPIIYIYDASGSMWGQLEGQTKQQIASSVLAKALENLPAEQQVGLVAYGHRRKGDCEDVEFLVDMDNTDKDKVSTSVKSIKPLGKTPLAYSALQVINQLKANQQKATIILITDGIEVCGGDICDVIKTAKAEGIEFKLHILGFGLKEGETEQLKCAAEAGNGNYYDASDADGLSDVLNEANNTKVDELDKNVSVFVTKNGKPIDAHVTTYVSGAAKTRYGVRTYQDTGFFYLSSGTYDLKVEPLGGSDVAPITLSGIEVVEDSIIHRDVSFDSGTLNVFISNNMERWDATVKVFPKGEKKRAASGRTYGRIKTLDVNPGVYDVEILALRVNGLKKTHRFENVEIKANETTETKYDFKTGILLIGAKTSSEQLDAVVKVIETSTQKNVESTRTYTRPKEANNTKEIILNPGTYEVRLTALGKHKDKGIKTITIEIKAGETLERVVEF